jgi:hypothetical protein
MQDDVEEKDFSPVLINGPDSRFLDYLVDFRVAIGASCFPLDQRPSNPRYAFPSPNDEPFYDCSSFPTFAGGVPPLFQEGGGATPEINYGGAAVSRYTSVTDLELAIKAEEGIRVIVMVSTIFFVNAGCLDSICFLVRCYIMFIFSLHLVLATRLRLLMLLDWKAFYSLVSRQM